MINKARGVYRWGRKAQCQWGGLVHVYGSCSHLLLVLVHDAVLLFVQLVQLVPQPAAALLYVLGRKAA